MAEVFIGLVKQMVIFLIAGQTILRFGMGKAYERYIKLIISLMVIAQFISVLFGLFPSAGEKEVWASKEQLVLSFEERWAENIKDFERRLTDKHQQLEGEWKKDMGYSEAAQKKGEAKPSEGSLTESGREDNQIIIEEIKIQ